MEAKFTYAEDEVMAIVLAHHWEQFDPPDGMKLYARDAGYRSGAVVVEAVKKDAEGESHEPQVDQG